jgi:hypothetical protein
MIAASNAKIQPQIADLGTVAKMLRCSNRYGSAK